MSSMRTNKWIGFCVVSCAAIYATAACGSDEPEDNTDVTPTDSPTGTMPTPGTGTMPAPGTGPAMPGTGPAMPGTGPAMPGTTPAMTGTMPPPESPFPACPAPVNYMAANGANTTAALDGAESIFFFGDGTTTGCSDLMMAGSACMYGNAPPADMEYMMWGAGMGLQLAQSDGMGGVIAAFDATALGIVGLKVTFANVQGRPVRIQLAQINDPVSGTPYQENGFVLGGSAPVATTMDGEVTAMFTEFMLPSWTGIANGAGQMVDASQLHSLQFQIANEPTDMQADYSFCISNLQWVDAAGTPIDVPEPMAPGAGGMGGMPSGGMGGMPSGGMGGMPSGGMGGMPSGGMGGMSGGMGGMSGGMGGMGGDIPSFAADIHPIMTEKCAPCHDAASMSGGRTHAQADADMAYASAMTMPETIVERIELEESEFGHMPPMTSQAGQLTADEIALIVAWVEGGTPE